LADCVTVVVKKRSTGICIARVEDFMAVKFLLASIFRVKRSIHSIKLFIGNEQFQYLKPVYCE
jgi:hypothetical protein